MLVLDASVTLAWVLIDEESTYADAVLQHVAAQGARVPSIWVLETLNGLLMAEKSKRLPVEQSGQFRQRLLRMHQNRRLTVSDLRPAQVFNDVAALAKDQKLTGYDAAYLYLASAEGLPLATIDKELAKAAARVRVSVWDMNSSRP